MGIDIRPAEPADYPEIGWLDGAAFGVQYSEQEYQDAFGIDPPELIVATEGGRLVGGAGHFRFSMTVPGGAVDVPGVTWVSVSPTDRRRGVLRELMRWQLSQYAEAGEAAAILTASEGGIYGRFGYGPATRTRKTVLDRRLVRLTERVDASEVRLVRADEARKLLPELHQRWRQSVPGALSRTESWWDYRFLDRESNRGGMSAKFYLVHPEGYLAYRIAENWTDGFAEHRCAITDYVPLTSRAHAALWQVMLGLDLVASIESQELPPDDPLPFLLSNQRALRTVSLRDGVWLRPINVAALLSARCYSLPIETVLQVSDPLLGDQRLLLTGGPDGASCEPTNRPAEIDFSPSGLGSAYLGGHRLHTLAGAGLVRCDDAALLSRLQSAFLTDREPLHGTAF